MTTRQLGTAALVAGVGASLTNLTLDLTSIWDFEPWEIAASFPLGAVAFLACWFLGEVVAKP